MEFADQQTLEFIESLDASAGHVLLSVLEDEWFRTGVQAACNGQPQTALWNNVQRAGYRAWKVTSAALAEQREATVCAN
jgi:hypothetical protein